MDVVTLLHHVIHRCGSLALVFCYWARVHRFDSLLWWSHSGAGGRVWKRSCILTFNCTHVPRVFFFFCTIHPQFHSICCITWPCAPAVYSPRFMAEMLLSRCARLHFLADVPVFLLPLDAHRSSGTGVNCSFVMCNAPSLEETPIDKGALARDRANALWN